MKVESGFEEVNNTEALLKDICWVHVPGVF